MRLYYWLVLLIIILKVVRLYYSTPVLLLSIPYLPAVEYTLPPSRRIYPTHGVWNSLLVGPLNVAHLFELKCSLLVRACLLLTRGVRGVAHLFGLVYSLLRRCWLLCRIVTVLAVLVVGMVSSRARALSSFVLAFIGCPFQGMPSNAPTMESAPFVACCASLAFMGF